jgi:SNF2 family DNA or RNA helicase
VTFRAEHSLYPYQQEALDVMVQKNTLLAYDMGVGKTPTTLAAIEDLREEKPLNALILVPNSVKWQWAHEIAKFTDQDAVVIDGTPAKRARTYMDLNDYPPPYLVMTYGTFMRDFDRLPHIDVMVLDEATAIKGFRSQRSNRVKMFGKKVPIRFALTGTPIENGKLEELYSIMEYVNPHVLGQWWAFEKRYIIRNQMGWVERYKNVDDFHARISSNTLRRTHDDPDVAKYLPAVITPDPIVVPFRRYSQDLYDRIETEVLSDLDDMVETMGTGVAVNIAAEYGKAPAVSHDDRRRGTLMSKITVLRMLADHPDVVRLSGLRDDGSKYARALLQDGQLDRPVREGSAKLDALAEYVLDFLDISERNKAVIFSTYVDMLPLIQQALGAHKCVLFHGGLSDKERDAVKTQFQTDRATRVFISSDAGGYGVDLPQANLLVNYDQPWQAGMAKQRNARIRRAASEWTNVTVQDFLSEGSIEERIHRMVAHKHAVSTAALDGTGITLTGEVASSLESLRSFLREGVV